MFPSLKMRLLSCLLRLSLPPEMDEIAETFMYEIEWLALLKSRSTGLSTSLFLTERECSASLTDVEFVAFAAGYAVNNVRRSACEIIPDNNFGFGSKNDNGLTKEAHVLQPARPQEKKKCRLVMMNFV